MKIAILHAANVGFFPRYYKAIASAIESNGDDVALFVPNSGRNKRNVLPNQQTFGSRLNWHVHYNLYKLTGVQDVYSVFSTMSLISKLKAFHPDVIHMNVVNDKIINMPMLVRYINNNTIPVVWTMHDCRAFTGQCPYFDEVNCMRWQTGCAKCPQCATWIDNTHLTWKIRRKWHAGINNLTVVTPSRWLADFVKESFLKKHPVKVIYNGVDIDGFSHETISDVRKAYDIIPEKKIVLGCSIFWEKRKGLIYFEQLVKLLPDNYQIVLVGNINDEQKQKLNTLGIICTGRTKTFDEMVAWYQTASVFCNPTMADNFPTVNIEALAAGTPVVTFNTGGSPEAIDENTGVVVRQGNIKMLRDAVVNVAEHKESYTYENCIRRSKFFSNKEYDLYIELYETIMQQNRNGQ